MNWSKVLISKSKKVVSITCFEFKVFYNLDRAKKMAIKQWKRVNKKIYQYPVQSEPTTNLHKTTIFKAYWYKILRWKNTNSRKRSS